MERASAFTSIPGVGGVIIGVSAIATAIVAQPLHGDRWLAAWLADAVFAAIVAFVLMARKASRAGVTLRSPAARRFFVSYFAPVAAAALMTVAIVRTGDHERARRERQAHVRRATGRRADERRQHQRALAQTRGGGLHRDEEVLRRPHPSNGLPDHCRGTPRIREISGAHRGAGENEQEVGGG